MRRVTPTRTRVRHLINTDFEPSLAAIAVELEVYFAKEAAERISPGTNQYTRSPELIPETSKGDAREHAAEALNTSPS